MFIFLPLEFRRHGIRKERLPDEGRVFWSISRNITRNSLVGIGMPVKMNIEKFLGSFVSPRPGNYVC